MFDLALFAVSIIAGSIASVTGFGIGSLVTPVLSLAIGTKLAVAVVSIPHLVATTLRFCLLRSHVEKHVLVRFGIMSALGGLTGALLHTRFASSALTLIFGCILVFAGFTGIGGISEKMRFHGSLAWAAGAVSGFLGGLVGNQGGIRSAALMGFQMSKESFVATATATGLIVDLARMPIYFWHESEAIFSNFKLLGIATVGVVVGTLLGHKLLKRLPERIFRTTVSALIFVLGLFMVWQGRQG